MLRFVTIVVILGAAWGCDSATPPAPPTAPNAPKTAAPAAPAAPTPSPAPARTATAPSTPPASASAPASAPGDEALLDVPGTAMTNIALLPPFAESDFWASVNGGAQRACTQLKRVILGYVDPLGVDLPSAATAQANLIENLTATKEAAILLGPATPDGPRSAAARAVAAGIPVIVIDRPLAGAPGKDYTAYVRSDPQQCGQLGARRIAEVLHGRGRVLLVRVDPRDNYTLEREDAFAAALGAMPGLQLVDPRRYAGPSREGAATFVAEYLAGDAEIQGVFCAAEATTFGAWTTLHERKLTDKIALVGVGKTPGLEDALKKGEIGGLLIEGPNVMGRLALKTALDAVAHRPFAPLVNVPMTLATPTTGVPTSPPDPFTK